ncbi:MAG: D-alanyl-D-alanine carboxypeptidase/D-alanyl-D-alanine-endopeptidase [Methylophilaceae bacterium]|nr:D-alanyl-D-alanine carboxypeptidase/D-alanyl-D-alanine-endopeptidase [Methylophilaceae bacterium]
MSLVALKASIKIAKIGIFFLLAASSFRSYAELTSSQNPEHSQLPASVITALQKAKIPLKNTAVYLQALYENQPVISHNASQPFNPASVMKLLTTNAALDLLGPAYRWRTEIYTDGAVINGVLNGNLLIKGYGDPSLNEAEFRRLLVSLQQTGVKKIHGNLILDKSYFASTVGNPVTFDAETYRAYNAMPSAILVNSRATSFKFQAAAFSSVALNSLSLSSTAGQVSVVQEVEVTEIRIINQLKLIQGDCGDWRNKFKYVVTHEKNTATITFTGSYSADCGDKYLELSLFNDSQYAYFIFRKLWQELGGSFSGILKSNTITNDSATTASGIPASASKLVSQESKPLADVLRDINKYSNNLMARQLLLTIAAEKSGLPATESLGKQEISAWLLNKNMTFNELVIENGSGLSRIERISAQHLGDLLVSAYHSPVMSEFMSSLPILGADGTVIKRLKDRPVMGRAHIKTGSIDGVSSIAGYVLDANNKRWAIVFLVNDANAVNAKAAQDALIEWVYSSEKS